jgi:hypothetical protein
MGLLNKEKKLEKNVRIPRCYITTSEKVTFNCMESYTLIKSRLADTSDYVEFTHKVGDQLVKSSRCKRIIHGLDPIVKK